MKTRVDAGRVKNVQGFFSLFYIGLHMREKSTFLIKWLQVASISPRIIPIFINTIARKMLPSVQV